MTMMTLLLVMLVGCYVVMVAADCSMWQPVRHDCAFGTLDRGGCLERGCCWQPCHGCSAQVPWCFLSRNMLVERCMQTREEKKGCGNYGIKQNDCLVRGCCWKPSREVNDPWCFQGKAAATTITITEEGSEGQVRLRDWRDWWASYDEANDRNRVDGRVQIYHEGRWGTVCHDSFGKSEAQVVCRQLGLFGGVMRYNDFGRRDGDKPIWMDELGCEGWEDRLTDCSFPGWGDHDCTHREDVGVVCDSESNSTVPGTEEGDIRLVNGTDHGGRLEIYYGGGWGNVCDDNFTSVDGDVVCRQLGFTNVSAVITSFGRGMGRILLDNVNCTGFEDKLQDCGHEGWSRHDCSHWEDVGVICQPTGTDEITGPTASNETVVDSSQTTDPN